MVTACGVTVSCVCIVSPGSCLPKLPAWHLEAVVMKMMSVQVCSESTGHAEAVSMTHDPQQVVYCKLVDMLWPRHNFTSSNRVGNDIGAQYRSGIYHHTDEQKQVPPSLFLSVDLGSTRTLGSQHVFQFCEVWCV